MVADDMAADFAHAIGFRGAAHVNDFLPVSGRDFLKFEGPRRAFELAYDRAGVTARDLDFAEVHDCFTIAELLVYDSMGLAAPGKGATCLAEGTVMKGGALPVNLSGGLKAKGHPVGATGVSMHVLAAQQLSGTAAAPLDWQGLVEVVCKGSTAVSTGKHAQARTVREDALLRVPDH